MITATITGSTLYQKADNTLYFALMQNGNYLDASTLSSAELKLCHEDRHTTYTLPDFTIATIGGDNVLELDFETDRCGSVKMHMKINGFGVNLSQYQFTIIGEGC